MGLLCACSLEFSTEPPVTLLYAYIKFNQLGIAFSATVESLDGALCKLFLCFFHFEQLMTTHMWEIVLQGDQHHHIVGYHVDGPSTFLQIKIIDGRNSLALSHLQSHSTSYPSKPFHIGQVFASNRT